MIDNNVFASIKESIDSGVSRRKFLQLSGIGTGAILGASVLARLNSIAAPAIRANEGILLVINLFGGNDPLTMLAPYSDNTYRSLRPTLSLSPEATDVRRKCLPIGKVNGVDYGFHANLPTIKAMYDQGKVAVVPGIGYAGQTLSHFSTTEYYSFGWDGAATSQTSGWAGRFLDTFSDAAQESTRSITLNSTMPLSIMGNKSKPIALPTILQEAYAGGTDKNRVAINLQAGTFGGYSNPLMSMIADSVNEASMIPTVYGPSYKTPPSNQARSVTRLTTAAGVINANLGTRIMQVEIGNFDVHTGALDDHPRLLKELDDSIAAFFNGLNDQWKDRVTVLLYSEFGRRVQENGQGTDHGRASMAMLIGNKVSGGIKNAFPSLTNLDNAGNLVESMDFREVYGNIATEWLNTDSKSIIGKDYPKLGLFTAGPGGSTNTTQPPTTAAPTTIVATTQTPTTKAPVTTTTNAPTTTKGPAPTTAPPTTKSPTTTTAPPTTKAPTTTTMPPTTKGPTVTTIPVSTTPPGQDDNDLPNWGWGHGKPHRRPGRFWSVLKAFLGN